MRAVNRRFLSPMVFLVVEASPLFDHHPQSDAQASQALRELGSGSASSRVPSSGHLESIT
jgi:hypothetical protein